VEWLYHKTAQLRLEISVLLGQYCRKGYLVTQAFSVLAALRAKNHALHRQVASALLGRALLEAQNVPVASTVLVVLLSQYSARHRQVFTALLALLSLLVNLCQQASTLQQTWQTKVHVQLQEAFFVPRDHLRLLEVCAQLATIVLVELGSRRNAQQQLATIVRWVRHFLQV